MLWGQPCGWIRKEGVDLMDEQSLRELLEGFQNGSIDLDGVIGRLRRLPFEKLGFANVDHHRAMRLGAGEVVFCPGKSPDQIIAILKSLQAEGLPVLATRAEPAVWEEVRKTLPELQYHAPARLIGPAELSEPGQGEGSVLVISAGTSDIPIAEEALLTARFYGARAEGLYDVGVAGLHRLLAHLERLQQARALVVVAGMEGALPSVVGGLVGVPVIGVPTSVGYGASLKGMAALLGMLNSCASNVTVVNIDNGFGAGCVGALINRGALKGPDHA